MVVVADGIARVYPEVVELGSFPTAKLWLELILPPLAPDKGDPDPDPVRAAIGLTGCDWLADGCSIAVICFKRQIGLT